MYESFVINYFLDGGSEKNEEGTYVFVELVWMWKNKSVDTSCSCYENHNATVGLVYTYTGKNMGATEA